MTTLIDLDDMYVYDCAKGCGQHVVISGEDKRESDPEDFYSYLCGDCTGTGRAERMLCLKLEAITQARDQLQKGIVPVSDGDKFLHRLVHWLDEETVTDSDGNIFRREGKGK